MSMIANKNEFKFACREFLSGFSLNALRSFGRDIGVSNPTKDKKKKVLIEEIVLVLSGEIMPCSPSTLGAPVKNDFVDPKIHEGINRIRMMYTDQPDDDFNHLKEQFQRLKENPHYLVVEDPNARELEKNGVPEVYVGQLETLNGVSVLLPLNCMDTATKIIVSVEMIRSHDLREGDVISCYAEKRHSVLVATVILTVNEEKVDLLHRGHFDDCNACYPHQKLNFHDGNKNAALTGKMLQWLVAVGKGQRGLVIAPPKSGKSMLLMEMAALATRLNKDLTVMSLLIDQAPEAVGQFRKIVGDDHLVYTTYEDDSDRQVFASEFILKRAKRYAESGKDVLLFVDSLNALSRAFNDTESSIGGKVFVGGLESKTVQYLKRYFGTARCLERGGSITIIGALATDTGNPADDFLQAELSTIANLEICLSEELAKRRIYPAVDLLKTRGKGVSMVSGTREDIFNAFIRNEYFPVFGPKGVLELLSEVADLNELEDKAYKQLKTKKN
ncbi:MAG: hypothetical protein IJ284_04420 [Clostridia bacterium]|nr:hypothetical protein [Clostridia bacterium]